MKQKKRKSLGPLLILLILAAGFLYFRPQLMHYLGRMKVAQLSLVQTPEWIDVQIIDVDGTSRRGETLQDIRNIVIHYVGNPGTTAQQNHNWYENPESQVSSHFLVGLEGEIIQCIPLDEYSSASNHRNCDTISIEVCHPDESGRFSDSTYASLVKLTAWLLSACNLEAADVIRHYDITGKDCPRYFVQHEDSWLTFLEDVARAVPEKG